MPDIALIEQEIKDTRRAIESLEVSESPAHAEIRELRLTIEALEEFRSLDAATWDELMSLGREEHPTTTTVSERIDDFDWRKEGF